MRPATVTRSELLIEAIENFTVVAVQRATRQLRTSPIVEHQEQSYHIARAELATALEPILHPLFRVERGTSDSMPALSDSNPAGNVEP